MALVAGLSTYAIAWAQAPAGSTGACKDGSYTSVAKKRGACAGHGGVKDWYSNGKSEAKEASKSSTATAEPKETKAERKAAAAAAKSEAANGGKSAMPAAAGAGAMAAPAAAGAMTKTASSKHMAMPENAAAGGGPGKVWVNTSSHVYHCNGDEWYGKTKQGEYMSEADAKSKGDHPAHGKACG